MNYINSNQDPIASLPKRSLIGASKNSPCPHCGKPDWCYSIGELSVCKRDAEPATGWNRTGKADGDGTPYYAPLADRWEKPIRPAKTTYYNYPDREGKPLVRVERIDKGDGNKSCYQSRWNGKMWVKGLDGIARSDIPIYRCGEVREAIARGKTVFIVEGEGKADRLWQIGLAATCNIGGSGKWKPSDSEDLVGASVVLCPDRDKPGIAHMEAIARDFPGAKWLYAFPNSPLWQHLPDSKGADIADWIDEGATRDDILAVIGEKRELAGKTASKVVPHPTAYKSIGADKLLSEIDRIIDKNLPEDERAVELGELQDAIGRSVNVFELYEKRVNRLDLESERDDNAAALDRLLEANTQQLPLKEIFPEQLAEAIELRAKLLELRPEAFATALLCGLSSVHHPNTRLLAHPQTDWYLSPNLFGAIVAESGTGKTPIKDAMVKRPINSLKAIDTENYNTRKLQYEEDLIRYETLKQSGDRDTLRAEFPAGPPREPKKPRRYFGSTTGEGLAQEIAANPDKGILYLKDELAGIFKSANMYRGGRGSDSEDILEYYDGTGPSNLRSDKSKDTDCDTALLSIFGTIQPGVLQKLLGNGDDDSGNWARFMFCYQPETVGRLSIDDPKIDLTPMLADLYKRFDRQPERTFTFTRPAAVRFLAARNRIAERKVSENKPAMKAVYGKVSGRIGKLALNLHLIKYLFVGEEVPSEIERDTVNAAIKLAHFYVGQVEALYTRLIDGDSIASHLAKVIDVAERKGGWIVPRDVIHSLSSQQKKIYKASDVKAWFSELAAMGKGEIDSSGRSVSFRLLKTEVTNVTSIVTTSGNNLNPLQDKGFIPNVTNVTSVTTCPIHEKVELDNLPDPPDPSIGEGKNIDFGNTGNTGNVDPQSYTWRAIENVTTGDNNRGNKPLDEVTSVSVKCGGYVLYRGKSYTVTAIDGDIVTVTDWRDDSTFTVPIADLIFDTPGKLREAKNRREEIA